MSWPASWEKFDWCDMKGKPAEQQMERDKKWRKQIVGEGEGRLPHTLARDFSFVSGCKHEYLQDTIFAGMRLAPREQISPSKKGIIT